jgi:hypothetical protein|tara:strand:- start:831 stop:1058 length:228 start_codon:yes stop_codon:yes gene_type:complete
MKIDNQQQLILIEALRCYRDKLVSMQIDAKPVNDFLNEFRREKSNVEAAGQKTKEAVIINPQIGRANEGNQEKQH